MVCTTYNGTYFGQCPLGDTLQVEESNNKKALKFYHDSFSNDFLFVEGSIVGQLYSTIWDNAHWGAVYYWKAG